MIFDLDKEKYNLTEDFCIALGNFDGLHLGHQCIIKQLIKMSKAKNCHPSVLLFKEHTKTALEKKEFKSLTKLEDKIELLNSMGINNIFLIDFNNIKNLSPDEFLNNLKNELNIVGIVVGNDYKFGKAASGNIEYLKKFCELNNICLNTLEQVQLGETPIKSTNIRNLIQIGNVRDASTLLGRPYQISGTVTHGYHRGRLLGFPTANTSDLNGYILPKEGVYLTKTRIIDLNEEYYSLSFVGKNVTFNENEIKIETYILDYNGDVYGKKIAIKFLDFIRDNIKFNSTEELVSQIFKDTENARKLIQK